VAPTQPLAFAVGLLVGVASISFMTASTAIVQMTAAPSMRGRVLALQAMVFLGSTPIGGPIVGTISERFGARYGLLVGAVAALAAGLFGLAKVRARARDDATLREVPVLAAEPSLRDPVITPRAS
jgi:MFS family permease